MKKSLFFTFVLLAMLPLAACEPVVANRGNLVEPDLLTQIEPGVTDQASVQALLGPPTMIGTFDKNTWYYSGQRTKRMAFFDPKVSSERTVIIAYDDNGIVKEIKELEPGSGEEINPVARKTPSAGHDMTYGEQLMDNFSRPGLPGSLGGKKQR
jgi:outer membrane protein assembly factor BamE (lipoprotein component of BamABCDE complex)